MVAGTRVSKDVRTQTSRLVSLLHKYVLAYQLFCLHTNNIFSDVEIISQNIKIRKITNQQSKIFIVYLKCHYAFNIWFITFILILYI